MYAKAAAASARLLVGATIVVCTLFAGNATAKDKLVTLSVQVKPQGLDLSQSADAQLFYKRLQNAAWSVCTRETRVDLLPVDPPKVCYEKALGAAIRSAKAPTLTQVYLATHTLQEAAAYGVEVPAQLVAK
jgi:UrcA family protein